MSLRWDQITDASVRAEHDGDGTFSPDACVGMLRCRHQSRHVTPPTAAPPDVRKSQCGRKIFFGPRRKRKNETFRAEIPKPLRRKELEPRPQLPIARPCQNAQQDAAAQLVCPQALARQSPPRPVTTLDKICKHAIMALPKNRKTCSFTCLGPHAIPSQDPSTVWLYYSQRGGSDFGKWEKTGKGEKFTRPLADDD